MPVPGKNDVTDLVRLNLATTAGLRKSESENFETLSLAHQISDAKRGGLSCVSPFLLAVCWASHPQPRRRTAPTCCSCSTRRARRRADRGPLRSGTEIPSEHVVRLKTVTDDEIDRTQYEREIERPIAEWIAARRAGPDPVHRPDQGRATANCRDGRPKWHAGERRFRVDAALSPARRASWRRARSRILTFGRPTSR